MGLGTKLSYSPGSSSTFNNKVEVEVTFPTRAGSEEGMVTTTVTGCSWVSSSMIILCVKSNASTTDHNVDEVGVTELEPSATNLVAGVGFDLRVYAPKGARGKFKINCIGVGA